MKNWILAASCTAFAAACFIETLSFPSAGAMYRSPAIYPQVVIAIIVVLCVVLVAGEALKKMQSATPAFPSKASLRLPVLLVAALVAYYVLMPLIGFVIATFTFIAIVFMLFGGRLLPGSGFAAIMTAGQYVLFAVWLDVRVPDPVIAFIKHSLSG